MVRDCGLVVRDRAAGARQTAAATGATKAEAHVMEQETDGCDGDGDGIDGGDGGDGVDG